MLIHLIQDQLREFCKKVTLCRFPCDWSRKLSNAELSQLSLYEILWDTLRTLNLLKHIIDRLVCCKINLISFSRRIFRSGDRSTSSDWSSINVGLATERLRSGKKYLMKYTFCLIKNINIFRVNMQTFNKIQSQIRELCNTFRCMSYEATEVAGH